MNREERWKLRLALLGLASFAPAGWSIVTGPAPAARPPEAAAMADDREPTRRTTWCPVPGLVYPVHHGAPE